MKLGRPRQNKIHNKAMSADVFKHASAVSSIFKNAGYRYVMWYLTGGFL